MKRYGNQLWVQVVGPDRYRIGMTDQLQCDAGNISYANIAPLGALDVDDTLVNLEASKAAIEVASPLKGQVVARNEAAEANPSLLDSKNPADHWLIELSQVDTQAYEALAEEE